MTAAPRHYAPVVTGDVTRVATFYEVESEGCPCSGSPMVEVVDFDRLHEDLQGAGAQLPERCLAESVAIHAGEAEWAVEVEVYRMDRGRHVAVVRASRDGGYHDVIDALEVFYRREFAPTGYTSWADYLDDRGYVLGAFTFQLVAASDGIMRLLDRSTDDARQSMLGSLVYRYAGRYDSLSSRVVWPEESNRGESLAVVSPFSAIIGRHQGYVENAFFLSAVLYVGARVTLLSLRRRLYENLRRVGHLQRAEADPRLRRAALGRVSSSVGAMEVELSANVESYLKVESLLLSLRASDFHESLFRSARVGDEAAALAVMLERLRSGVQGELAELASIYGARDERRRVLASGFVGALSAVAVPLGILFGYFGMNADEVDPGTSFMDVGANTVIYGLLLVLLGATLLLALVLAFALRRLDRTREARVRELMDGGP